MPGTLIDLLDSAVTRYGEKPALGLRHDDGTTTQWSYRELDRRARIAAWRLRALDLEAGDRILTWSNHRTAVAATKTLRRTIGASCARICISTAK